MNQKKAILLIISFFLYTFSIIAMETEGDSLTPSSSPSYPMNLSPTISPGQSGSLSSSPTNIPSLLKGAANKSLQLLEETTEHISLKKFNFSPTVKASNPGLESWPVLNMILSSKSKAVDTDLKGGALCSNSSTQDATGDMLAALIDVNKKMNTEYEQRILNIISATLDNEKPTDKKVIEATQKLLLEKVAICNRILALITEGIKE